MFDPPVPGVDNLNKLHQSTARVIETVSFVFRVCKDSFLCVRDNYKFYLMRVNNVHRKTILITRAEATSCVGGGAQGGVKPVNRRVISFIVYG